MHSSLLKRNTAAAFPAPPFPSRAPADAPWRARWLSAAARLQRAAAESTEVSMDGPPQEQIPAAADDPWGSEVVGWLARKVGAAGRRRAPRSPAFGTCRGPTMARDRAPTLRGSGPDEPPAAAAVGPRWAGGRSAECGRGGGCGRGSARHAARWRTRSWTR